MDWVALSVFRCSRNENVDTNRIEEILASNSSLVSGLSEASGVKLSWVEVSKESSKIPIQKNRRKKSVY